MQRNYPHSEQHSVENVENLNETCFFLPNFLPSSISMFIGECRKYDGNFAFLVFSICAWLWEMGNFKRLMHIFRLVCRMNGEKTQNQIKRRMEEMRRKEREKLNDQRTKNLWTIFGFCATVTLVSLSNLKQCLGV